MYNLIKRTCWVRRGRRQLWRWTGFCRVQTTQRLVCGWFQFFGIVARATWIELDISFSAATIRPLLKRSSLCYCLFHWRLKTDDSIYFAIRTHITTHVAGLFLKISRTGIGWSSFHRRWRWATTAACNRDGAFRQFWARICWHRRNTQYASIAHAVAAGYCRLGHQAQHTHLAHVAVTVAHPHILLGTNRWRGACELETGTCFSDGNRRNKFGNGMPIESSR